MRDLWSNSEAHAFTSFGVLLGAAATLVMRWLFGDVAASIQVGLFGCLAAWRASRSRPPLMSARRGTDTHD